MVVGQCVWSAETHATVSRWLLLVIVPSLRLRARLGGMRRERGKGVQRLQGCR